jgi:hypothetical protein
MKYYTLIASLPHLPAHFDVARPPISRPRLNQRLTQLNEQDTKVLQQLSDFLAWDRQTLERSERDVINDYDRLQEKIRHPVVKRIMDDRINMRTIVGALRRRRDREGPPTGVGRLVRTIHDHWQQPQFGLQRRYSWIEPFEKRMLEGEAVEAERVLYEHNWNTCCRMASCFQFSFEAVLLYLVRWSIVDRWTSRDREAGLARFDQLLEETLGEYAQLQF